MATKRYNQQNFYIELNNKNVLAFYCWTTKTRCGFCHTCWCVDNNTTSKVSYYNRPWELYDYQSVLRKSFAKFPKDTRKELELWDDWKEKEVHNQCEKSFEEFKKMYDATPQSFKDALANSDVHLETEEQVESLKKVMAIASILK